MKKLRKQKSWRGGRPGPGGLEEGGLEEGAPAGGSKKIKELKNKKKFKELNKLKNPGEGGGPGLGASRKGSRGRGLRGRGPGWGI